jgi:hypothetical protein
MPRLGHLARILVAAALLAAQQVALEHALWHAGGAQAATTEAKKSDPARNPLCEQHASMGAVLGAIGCASAPAAVAASDYAAPRAPAVAARDNAPLVSASRDPPVRL